jgi:hypothetical protein
MTPTSTTKPLQDFIRVSEPLLSDEITADNLGSHEVAIVKTYIDMLADKFPLET